jgi:hypothetical protein
MTIAPGSNGQTWPVDRIAPGIPRHASATEITGKAFDAEKGVGLTLAAQERLVQANEARWRSRP